MIDINRYMRYTQKCAGGYARRTQMTEHFEDMVGAGYIGIAQSLARYRQGDYNFERSCPMRIKGAIVDYIRQNTMLTRPSKRFLGEIEWSRQKLFTALGRLPDREEIARHLHFDIDDFDSAESAASISIDDEIDIDTLSGGQYKPVYIDLKRAFWALSDREMRYIDLHYSSGLTQAEIAELDSISHVAVYLVIKRAVGKMKDFLDDFTSPG